MQFPDVLDVGDEVVSDVDIFESGHPNSTQPLNGCELVPQDSKFLDAMEFDILNLLDHLRISVVICIC